MNTLTSMGIGAGAVALVVLVWRWFSNHQDLLDQVKQTAVQEQTVRNQQETIKAATQRGEIENEINQKINQDSSGDGRDELLSQLRKQGNLRNS